MDGCLTLGTLGDRVESRVGSNGKEQDKEMVKAWCGGLGRHFPEPSRMERMNFSLSLHGCMIASV